jgi:riboflavin synthase
MFTGIVEEVGVVREAREVGGDLRVTIAARGTLDGLAIGDSVACSGCCLTVVERDDASFSVELSRETVAKTSPRWHVGGRLNLERATMLGDRLGGHLVSGHVEGTGSVLAIEVQPGAHVVTVRAPRRLARYLIPKGSVTVDGVSLTVVDVGGPGGSRADLPATDFTLWLIPHTLAVTTLGDLAPGDEVNLEADLIAKYLERLAGMQAEDATEGTAPDPQQALTERVGGAGRVAVPKPNPPPPGPPEPPLPHPPAPPDAPPLPDTPTPAHEGGAS